MRNQAFLWTAVAAVAIATGCGGGHHHHDNPTTGSTGTSGTNGTPSDGLATGMNVVLPGQGYGRVEIEYLTGQGRAHGRALGRAVGDTFLEITRQVIQNSDSPSDQYVRSDLDALTPLELDLSGFQSLTTGIDIQPTGFSASPNSLLITQFVFDPNRVVTQTSTGLAMSSLPLPTAGLLPNSPDFLPFTVPYNSEARIRAFPNRVSIVQVRVSDASFYQGSFTSTSGDTYTGYLFNRTIFDELNQSTTGTDPTGQNLLASRLADYVRFDLSHLTGTGVNAAPTVRTSPYDTSATATAGFVYFSGDNIALSTAVSGGAFAEFAPTSDANGNADVVVGNWANSFTSLSTGQTYPGTFNLTEANPAQANGAPARLTALYGVYNDYNKVLTGGTKFEVVMFPNSGEKYDANQQGDLVAFVRNGSGQITAMYYGGVDLVDGTFTLLPIGYLSRPTTDTTIAAATISGTVKNFLGSNGSTVSLGSPGGPSAIRRFTFTITSGNAPSGFANSGSVTVLRS